MTEFKEETRSSAEVRDRDKNKAKQSQPKGIKYKYLNLKSNLNALDVVFFERGVLPVLNKKQIWLSILFSPLAILAYFVFKFHALLFRKQYITLAWATRIEYRYRYVWVTVKNIKAGIKNYFAYKAKSKMYKEKFYELKERIELEAAKNTDHTPIKTPLVKRYDGNKSVKH